MRRVNSIADVQIVLNDILNRLEILETKNLDMTSRRIVNLGNGAADTDAAAVGQIAEAVAALKIQIKKGLI